MTIRAATEADRELLRELWAAFDEELGGPAFLREPWKEAWLDIQRHVAEGIALIAEADGRPVGFALVDVSANGGRAPELTDLYVTPEARRQGTAQALIRHVLTEVRARGSTVLTLEVMTENSGARALYERLGFREHSRYLSADLDVLEGALDAALPGRSYGSIHVQTDDVSPVERAVRQFVPRLGRSEGSAIGPARNGWITVHDELCDREPRLLRRLARELSERLGGIVLVLGVEHEQVVRMILFDRGGVADEYASVPEFHGPLPPGDVVALRANPTVLARLTGAEPVRVRAVARSARSPAEMPPAAELVRDLAGVLGVSGPGDGYSGAEAQPGALLIRHG